MPAISANNITRLRYPYHAISNLKVNLFRLVVHSTAKINQASFTYPLLSLTVDNTSADWLDVFAGQYFRITDPTTGALKYEGVVRLFNDTTTEFRIARLVQGDTGRATEIAQSLADNDNITIYTAYVPFADFSRVDETDPTIFKKRWETEYTALGSPFNANPTPAIVAGAWRQIDASAGTAQWGVDLSGSYSLTGAGKAYDHRLDTGVTIVSGVATDASVTVEAAAGQYAYTFTVNDNPNVYPNGSFGVRYYFLNHPTLYPALSDQYAIEIVSDKEDLDAGGREVVLRVWGQDAINTLYVGAPVLMTYDIVTSQNGRVWSELESGASRRSFSGYVREYQQVTSDSGGVVGVEVVIVSPMVFARALPIPAQQIQEVASTVTNWQEIPASLNNMRHWFAYLLKWHVVSIGRLHDWDFSDAVNFKRAAMATAGGNFKAAVDSIAALALGTFSSSSDGALRFRRNPVVEGTTYRSSVANVFTWTAQDVRDNLEYTRNPLMRSGQLDGAYTVYGSGTDTAYQGRYALYAQAQGVDKGTMDDFIALSSSDGLQRIGHRFAELNRPTESITVRPRGLTGEFVDVSSLEYHTLDFEEYDPLATGLFNSRRAIPIAITRNWQIDARGVVCDASITMKPETQGVAATNLPIAKTSGGGIAPIASWCKTFDFTVDSGSAYGWQAVTLDGYLLATYSAGVGWTTADKPQTTGGEGGNRTTSIYIPSVAAQITSLQVFYTYTLGTEADGSTTTNWIRIANSLSVFAYQYNRTQASEFQGTATSYTWALSGTSAQLRVEFRTSRDTSSPYTYSGTATITKIIVRGRGTNPFGASDCI